MRKHGDSDTCPCCGAKTVDHKHNLMKGIAAALKAVGESANNLKAAVKINELGLTHNQMANFQKLRYWDLVRQTESAGEWQVSPQGWSWLTGNCKLPLSCWTYRARVVEFVGKMVSLTDVLEDESGYLVREDYIAA